ncbi:hypothetical protein FRC01_003368 [Tulasnella sp. 417]|nr:hypothetical protein FRC01_003368 [Tulasnella sp. 417]
MGDYTTSTDLAPYGPGAMGHHTSIVILEATQPTANIANVLGSFLAPAQRQFSRIAELSATSSSTRWVLEMGQVQAVSSLLQQRTLLQNTFSIVMTEETEVSPEERVEAREAASVASWGLGLASPTASDFISPIMLHGGPPDHIPAAPTPPEPEMELDVQDTEVIGYLGDEAGTALDPVEAGNAPPAFAPNPHTLQDPELSLMLESHVLTAAMQYLGGMQPSAMQGDIILQQHDEDDEDMTEEQLEEDIRRIEIIMEQEVDASRSGSGSLDLMLLDLNILHGLLHG